MQIQEVFGAFRSQLEANGRSSHTIRQYQRHVRALERFLKETNRSSDMAAVTHQVIASFLTSPLGRCRPDGKARKATSANAMRTSLRMFFDYLHHSGWITEDPCRMTRRAICEGPPPRALSEDEKGKLIAEMEKASTVEERRDRVLFLLMLETGIRIGSTLALRVEDVDLVEGVLRLRSTKGGREAEVFVPAATAAILREFLGERRDGLVFEGRGADGMTVRHAQRRFSELITRAGVTRRAGTHSLRHSFAVAIYGRTRDLLVTKAALGHRSIASTLVYAQLRPGALRRALVRS